MSPAADERVDLPAGGRSGRALPPYLRREARDGHVCQYLQPLLQGVLDRLSPGHGAGVGSRGARRRGDPGTQTRSMPAGSFHHLYHAFRSG